MVILLEARDVAVTPQCGGIHASRDPDGPRSRPASRDAERLAMLGAALLALAPAMVANVPTPRLSAVLFDV